MIFSIIPLSVVVSADEGYKNVQILSRWRGSSVFYLSEDNKLMYMSKNSAGFDEELSLWDIVPVDGGTYFTIQNVKTGGYLAILDEENVNDQSISGTDILGVKVDCVADGNETTAGQWQLVEYSGYKIIKNVKFPSQSLHVEGGDGYIYAANAPSNYWSAHWSLEVIDPNPVLEEYESVQISCREYGQTDKVFYLSEDNKLMYISKNEEYDKELSLWDIMLVEGTEYYTIQNRKTGGYLVILDEENISDEVVGTGELVGVEVACTSDGNKTEAGQWKVVENDGYKRITNAKFPLQALHIEGHDGYVHAANAPSHYHSAMWKFTEVAELAEFKNIQITCKWSTHTDAAFYLSEDNKLTYISAYGDYDKDLAKWNVIPVEGTDYYTIQNCKTGGYLAILDEENVNNDSIDQPEATAGVMIDCVADGNLTKAGQWKVVENDGYKRITNAKFPLQALHMEGANGYVYGANVPERYHSALWKFSVVDRYYSIGTDTVIDSGNKAVARNGKTIVTTKDGAKKTWTLSKDISGSPVFTAQNMPMMEAVYNRTMEETYENMYTGRYGTVFRTGTAFNTVWTRDTAMASQYSLAWIYPDEIENCLHEKIVGSDGSLTYQEDSGTGGSYPVSTDRIITTISAWEHYLTTGNKELLEEFYEYTENTIEQDLHVCFDKESGLFFGETGGLDHSDKTYPDWMAQGYEDGITNIAESKPAVVNIIYCRVYEIMARAADILGYGDDVTAKWNNYHDELVKTVNEHFWDPEMGLYVCWEYPNYMGSMKAYKYDVISNGYAIMFGVADEEKADLIMKNYPLVLYGADTVYPQKSSGRQIGSIYHNRGVWPGWESTLMIAGGQNGNYQLADEIFKSCVRGVAMEHTNYELFNFVTGDGVNSKNQLWSIAATLAGYYRVLFGMEYTEEGIVFKPYVADWMEGPFELANYKYRDADITFKLSGKGDTLVSVKLDGVEMGADYVLPTNLTGSHTVEMVVEDSGKRSEINLDDYNHVGCPDLPEMKYEDGVLTWTEDSRYTYKLWNGEEYIEVSGGSYTPSTDHYGAYSIIAVDADGICSEPSKPIIINPEENVIVIEAEDGEYIESAFCESANGSTGRGYVKSSYRTDNGRISVKVDIKKAGKYYLSTSYTANSGNCPIRSIYVDGEDYATMLFPTIEYYWQMSTHVTVELSEGEHIITLLCDPENWYDRNMSMNAGDVLIDSFTLEYADSFTTTAEAPESVVKNEKFNITVVTDKAAKDLKVMNESGRKVTSKVTSVTVNEDGSNTVVLELSVGTAGEARVLSIYAGDRELTTVTLNVLKYVTGILSVEAPAAAAKNELFKVKTITTNDLIKGKFKNESGSVIGSKCVSRVKSGDTLVTEYELSIGSSGEKRTITFYADYDKRSDFPFSESFTMAIVG